MTTPLGTELARIGQLQAHLPDPVVVVLGVVALGAALLEDIWRVLRHLVTLVHEGTHATVHSAIGHRVVGVTVKRDGTGATAFAGGPSFVSLLLGYMGPSLFGLLAAALIRSGHIVAVLWLAMALLLCMLIVVRTAFGYLLVVGFGVLIFVVAAYTSIGAQVVAAYVIAWFLLMSGIRVIREHGRNADDASQLRNLTRVPSGFWSFFWFVASLAALGFGATLLV